MAKKKPFSISNINQDNIDDTIQKLRDDLNNFEESTKEKRKELKDKIKLAEEVKNEKMEKIKFNDTLEMRDDIDALVQYYFDIDPPLEISLPVYIFMSRFFEKDEKYVSGFERLMNDCKNNPAQYLGERDNFIARVKNGYRDERGKNENNENENSGENFNSDENSQGENLGENSDFETNWYNS